MRYNDFKEDDLLSKLSRNDHNAFNEIYRRYWGDMFRSAYNILREKDDCMDIVQEIFVWLWEHRHTVRIISIRSYLLAAVKFKVANYIQKGKVRASFFDQLETMEEPQEWMSERIEVKELMTIITQFIDELPDKCRNIFVLSRQEQLSNKEIADRLNLSVKTVENQMTIALRKLRSSMKRISSFFLLFW